MSWFLIVVDGEEEAGVGMCNFSPGIKDLPTGGYMYVAPEEYVLRIVKNPERASPRKMREVILSYFGK